MEDKKTRPGSQGQEKGEAENKTGGHLVGGGKSGIGVRESKEGMGVISNHSPPCRISQEECAGHSDQNNYQDTEVRTVIGQMLVAHVKPTVLIPSSGPKTNQPFHSTKFLPWQAVRGLNLRNHATSEP